MSLQINVCKFCGAELRPQDNFCLNCGNRVTREVLHNRYTILEVVGQGGMGTVYKAEDIKLGKRLVAIKEMTVQGSQSQEALDAASRAFEREALLLAKLSHPYLPSIYDHFERNGHWYLVMEYIPGETLSQRLRSMPGGRLPLEQALDIGVKLCTVLSYLHTRTPPIVFGDLKPDNIMLTPEGDLYLIDFGIARLFQATHADEQQFVTAGYSAPEQYQSGHSSPRADIYSLGATLYQLLSGHHPSKPFHFAPLPLGNPLRAKDLEALIMSMLEVDEQNRPQDVALVKQRLQGMITGQTLEQSITPESQAWGGQVSNWGTPSSNDETSSLPPSVTYQDLQLSLVDFSDLVWSPDGSLLAATNSGEDIHIYAWPSEEKLLTSRGKTLAPLRTWSEKPLSSSAQKFNQRWGGPLPSIIAWSPDGTRIAVARSAARPMLCILNVSTADTPTYIDHDTSIQAVAWSPDGKLIASADHDTMYIWDAMTGKNRYSERLFEIAAIAWSPDSVYLAIANNGRTVRIGTSPAEVRVYQAITEHEVCTYYEHTANVYDVAWSPDGTYIVSCSADHTIHVWDAKTALKLRSLEGHTDTVKRIAFMDNARLLVSVSEFGGVYVWRTDTWAQLAFFRITPSSYTFKAYWPLAFHPTSTLIAASFFFESRELSVWKLDGTQLLGGQSRAVDIQYTNAKVVLLGDSGVGKSGLRLVLSHEIFVPTESTHGRVVRTFARHEGRLDDGRREIRETLLWDLAGQPGYRLIHQLHLSEVAVALVVFDAHSETDPFAGIAHWVRALHTAQRIRGNVGAMKKLLVLARIDRGGKRVSRTRIDELAQALGFDGYFETSAKEGTKIDELAEAIEHAINWQLLPKVSSTELFQRIKTFLVAEKQAGRLLSTAGDLYRTFLTTWSSGSEGQDFSAEFATGIRLLESADLIRRLSFGDLVLLQPELLDTYASALVNEARNEPDGLGSILEERALAGHFFIPADERIPDHEQEKLLLIAMVEDLLSYEIALREQGAEGPYLVFPSESTRENPALPDPENASVVFTFEGPVDNIYATLAVRLSHSGLFIKKELWKNAITYNTKLGAICGMWLKVVEEGQGELTLFFDAHASEETCFNFEEYVQVHLQRKALPTSVKRRRIFKCEACGLVASEQLIRIRIERGFNWYDCPGCGTRVFLLDREERLKGAAPSRVSEMDRAADVQRARAKAQTTIQGKQETSDFDVFLCYNKKDKAAVISIGERLKEQGLLPWLDEWELQPGLPWQSVLEQQIEQIKSAAVFIGKEHVGPWQQEELAAFLREFVARKCPVIPVLLPNAPGEPRLPVFLKAFTYVDFRKQEPDPMKQLIWGITGKHE